MGYRIIYGGDRDYDSMIEVMKEVKEKVRLELEELSRNFSGSTPLSAGSCSLCDSCAKTCGKPCIHPETMRYSIESIGGDVGRTISRLCGVQLEWAEEGKLPEVFTLVGALLKK